MERIKGLKEYVKSKDYREALGLPTEQEEEYKMLAQGEYNINYIFEHPKTGQKLLLRVNCGSQMHLEDQIGYEFYALQLLKDSGRTPKALYVDGSKKLLDHGIMVMEYLPGKALDYHTDMKYAAECLADIHSVRIPESEKVLIRPENPLIAILEECEEMVKTYMDSPLGKDKTKQTIRDLLDQAWKKARKSDIESTYACCINTELNSSNFLIGGEGKPNYLIDWEKPLLGDPAQDLGHFLAPTTTFWKTDVILGMEEIEIFIDNYIECVGGRFDTTGLKERTKTFVEITCLRGITWCAMAWVQYQQPDKLIVNEFTYRKLEAYLSEEFLEKIEKFLEHKNV
ncbi:MAG: phosphotransferase [Dorea sp.]